jgi:tungstate transport system substrate-binding protein
VCACLALAGCGRSAKYIVLATTTSVQNSGLLDRLAPAFRDETGLEIRTHLAGSGRALQMLRHGQADVVISHAPAAEEAFLRDVPDARYRKLMFNDFIVAGPAADPAGIRLARDAADAFRRIAASSAYFVSRGDASGTHERERALWDAAGASPAEQRLLTSGQGMAGTLRQASARGAYTLADRATFLQLQPQLDLARLFDRDPRLLNTYAVITRGGPREDDAIAFAVWLTSGPGRSLIDAFEVGPGVRAFTVWPAGCAAGTPAALPCGAVHP